MTAINHIRKEITNEIKNYQNIIVECQARNEDFTEEQDFLTDLQKIYNLLANFETEN